MVAVVYVKLEMILLKIEIMECECQVERRKIREEEAGLRMPLVYLER